jgi:uncharacterized LabA/DUF88 family protein
MASSRQLKTKIRSVGNVGTKKTTYAFVDASNIIYRDTDENPWKIDLQKLIKYLRERFEVGRVFYYGGIDNRNETQVKLYKKLEDWGYELRLNPVKKFVNIRGEFYTKADVDSRMTFEMMKYLSEYDRAVVLTGDGDFEWVLEYLLGNKEKIWLLASPGKTAKELKKLVGRDFANLDNLRGQLEFEKK